MVHKKIHSPKQTCFPFKTLINYLFTKLLIPQAIYDITSTLTPLFSIYRRVNFFLYCNFFLHVVSTESLWYGFVVLIFVVALFFFYFFGGCLVISVAPQNLYIIENWYSDESTKWNLCNKYVTMAIVWTESKTINLFEWVIWVMVRMVCSIMDTKIFYFVCVVRICMNYQHMNFLFRFLFCYHLLGFFCLDLRSFLNSNFSSYIHTYVQLFNYNTFHIYLLHTSLHKSKNWKTKKKSN